MTEDERQVGEYYDAFFEAEVQRLPEDFPVEFAVTSRILRRSIAGGTVAEIGVGGGHYSVLLAEMGCRLHLVDVSKRLLEYAAARVPQASPTLASATSLPLADASFDAVLLLGPLYHLREPGQRRAAVAEAARILRPGGLLFAAGINRLCYLRERFRREPERVLAEREFIEQHLADGNLDPGHAPPIGWAHLTGIDEFRALFEGSFEPRLLIGVESFAAPWQKSLNALSPEAREAWLDLVERTAATPEAIGHADHFLYVGSR